MTDTARIAVVHLPVLERHATATYVARRDVATLFVASPGFTDDDRSCFRAIPMSEAFELDPSLAEVGDLDVGRYAYRSETTDPWSYGTIPVGATFIIMVEARPAESNPDQHRVGGAFVTCWVVADSLESALQIADDHILESGWVIVERTRAETADPSEFEDGPFFKQVQIDGLVTVVHTFPREELELN